MNYNKQQLQQALTAVVPATGKTDILQCVKFGDGKLIAFDGDIYIEHKIPTDDNYCLDGKSLLNTIKTFPNSDISLELTAKTVKIKCDKLNGKYSLPIRSADDFPAIDHNPSTPVVIPGLIDKIKRVNYAASIDAIKPVFNAVYFDGNNLVATDSRRLAIISAETDANISVIMPLRFIVEVKRLFSDNVSLSIDNNMIIAQDETILIASRLVDGQFPNYKQVIPKESKHIINIDKDAFRGAVSRVINYASAPAFRLTFTLKGDTLSISANNSNGGEAEEHVTFDGDCDMTLAMNGQFVMNAVDNIDGDMLTMSMNAPMSPVVLTGTENDRHVIMPIQIKSEAEK